MKKSGGIAYEKRGEGHPFLALHGFSLDRRMSIGAFEPLFDAGSRAALPDGSRSGRRYRRIYPDLPLMGESGDLGPGEGSAADRMLGALLDFIAAALPAGLLGRLARRAQARRPLPEG